MKRDSKYSNEAQKNHVHKHMRDANMTFMEKDPFVKGKYFQGKPYYLTIKENKNARGE